MRDDIGIWRSIPTAKLVELLRVLPPGRHVIVNAVGNLNIMYGEPGHEDDWIWEGFIDIASEDYEPVLGAES